MARYFVTGGSGFVGGALIRHLVRDGHTVHALARNPDRAGCPPSDRVNLFRGDILDPPTLRPGMEGVDGVFHVAGWYKLGDRHPDVGMAINVEGTRNVLETMDALAIPRGVYTSTLAINSDTQGRMVDETYVYRGPHHTPYDRSKWRAHYEVAEPSIQHGLPLIIVEPGLIYGPNDTSLVHDTLVRFLRRRLPALPENTAYCWAHVDDIASAHVQAMERGRVGESYIIAGPPYSLIEAMTIASSITNIPLPPLHPSRPMMRIAASTASMVEKVVPLPAEFSSDALFSTSGTYLGSNAKARAELGYDPRALEVGLEETLRWEAHNLGRG